MDNGFMYLHKINHKGQNATSEHQVYYAIFQLVYVSRASSSTSKIP